MPDFSSNVNGGYEYNQYPYSPLTSNHLPGSPQHIYPTSAPAPTTFDVEVERLKSHFTQREDTFRATIAALLNKVASQQEIIKQNLDCFTSAMKEQMQLREKVEQSLQASNNAYRKALQVQSEFRNADVRASHNNTMLVRWLDRSDTTRRQNVSNLSDKIRQLSDKIVSHERLVNELKIGRKLLSIDSFRDQLKCLFDKVASLDSTVASVIVTARGIEDKLNAKVDSQTETNIAPVPATARDAKDGINYKIGSQPKTIERVTYSDKMVHKSFSFEKRCLDVREHMEEAIKRAFCRTHARGSMHLSGPCHVCKTKLPWTYVPDRVT